MKEKLPLVGLFVLVLGFLSFIGYKIREDYVKPVEVAAESWSNVSMNGGIDDPAPRLRPTVVNSPQDTITTGHTLVFDEKWLLNRVEPVEIVLQRTEHPQAGIFYGPIRISGEQLFALLMEWEKQQAGALITAVSGTLTAEKWGRRNGDR